MTHDQSTLTVDLNSEDYRDRVFGCWQGKNAGGTLGTPLEVAWGQEEPFDVWWYPELQEGGLPNDDFEMQLVWLKALEEIGPGLTARDLSRYWLDHIGYNFDEYGLSKLNLRLGLEPPVSGRYNNWFIDCMGSPIRSEIWACVAPGAPRVAALLAYQDAICDHAGGEGVDGELFNAALESAAFVVQDPRLLIDIALSYVSKESQVRVAVDAAVDARDAGLTWQEARKAVLAATPHYNAQYAPINTGFQVIGLLYGADFGEGICITVNCGYDTDSSGAAIGSYLGILHGASRLPQKWVEPLGNGISTNEDWGGVRHLGGSDNPVPADLDDLVARIRKVSGPVLRHHGILGDSAAFSTTLEDLYADDTIKALHATSPMQVPFGGDDLEVTIDYGRTPAIAPGAAREIRARLRNRRRDPVQVTAALRAPESWPALEDQRVTVEPGASIDLNWQVPALTMEQIAPSNRLSLELTPKGYPLPSTVPVVLVGTTAARLTGVYPIEGSDVRSWLDTVFEPEEATAEATTAAGRPGTWREIHSEGHGQSIADAFRSGPGVVYLQAFLHVPTARSGWLVVDPSTPIRYWLNGVETGRNDEFRLIRPNQKSADGIGAAVELREGWNEVLIKIAHDGQHPPAELHLAVSGPGRIHNYQFDIDRTSFPWATSH
ncbi:ADP-ribosylglycohydrolase family protein [Ruania alba]|uniref:ADP-ribosylglycohydrolase n=1 Tax=Ruania alba TaxID=648782 RepID=A0A1H5GXS3_9MICO|nr:ADP-ribosylglycohydrolase family protein [Ruania alba]SEE20415.1 ADP-ribosylglycohydrolase [Ruania alba]